MKSLVLSLCLLIACFSSLIASPIDQQKAQKVGAKFLSTTAISEKNADIQLSLVSVAANRDAADYYVFNVSNGDGFVIVAADDRVKPILAYSTEGSFDPHHVSEGFQFTLDGFREEIQYVREHNINATPDIVAEWNSVTATGHLQKNRQARAVVGPLCKALWDQDFPWNSQCPEDPEGSNGHVYAGCVATTMGMVMKFHEWPNRGEGSYTYNCEGYPQQSANFGETDYHFELMPFTLDSTSTEEEIFYVAQLLHHLGISVNMQYSGLGSGAYPDEVTDALRTYFRYTCDTFMANSWNIYSNQEWIQMLKEGGLDEHLPLCYSGMIDGGAFGHSFICDGYDENDYFHFNWGWGGCDNAWCPISALNTTSYAFNNHNGFTGHIIPQNGEYYARPDSVLNMAALENATFNGVRLSWTNPSADLNGNDLTSITSITVRRNFEVIAELTDAQAGANMEYDDNGLEPGLYEYAIFVTNGAGISRTTYRSLLVGEKCDIVFQLHDEGGDGWKGASISVTDAEGSRIAVVTMTEGTEKILTLPLLKGTLNFIWNSGWYHANEYYDTDDECSFTILNSEGNELFVSGELESGVFFTFDNDCENPSLTYESTDESIQVYPNPTNGSLNIEGQGTMRISISNLLGQSVQETIADGNITLDLSHFESGMYFVRIETKNGITVQKVNLIK